VIGLIPAQYRIAAGILAALAVSGALVGAGWYLGSRSEATAHANTRAKHAEEAAELARLAQRAAELASSTTLHIRDLEAATADRVAAIEAKRLEAVRRADETRDAVLRDLRAGRLSVRLPVRACPAGAAAGPAPATAAGSDGPAERGSGSQGFVALADLQPVIAQQIANSAGHDAQLAACQALIGEYRDLTDAAARDTGSREPRAGGQL
jgi:hypothetical protein